MKIADDIRSSANGDATITTAGHLGSVTVGRAWIAGSILASTTKGTDGFAGTGDHFGIVAQQIGKAKIGSVSLRIQTDHDRFLRLCPDRPRQGILPIRHL